MNLETKNNSHDGNTQSEPRSASEAATTATLSMAAPKDTGRAANPTGAWTSINKDLKTALDTWEILSEQVAHKVSPEEEQLREVKRLLVELKGKLGEFSK